MGDTKVEGYRLEDGSLFVPYPKNFSYVYDNSTKKTTANATYLNSDFTKIMGGIDKVEVGKKITFKNGNYLQVAELWSATYTDNSGPYTVHYYYMSLYKKDGTLVAKECAGNKSHPIFLDFDKRPNQYSPHNVAPCGLVKSEQDRGQWQLIWYDMYNDLEFGGTTIVDYKYGYTGSTISINMSLIEQYAGKKVSDYTKYKGDTSGGGGYGGSFDSSTDTIPLPNLPTINASSCGFVDMFKLTVSQTLALSDYLWSNANEFTEHIKKLFSNPMDAIISLSLCNITVEGTASTISFGGLSTGITGLKLSNQFAIVDCGSLTIPLYWGTALDYSPNAKAEIYLPNIGTVPICIDDILGKTVHVVYYCDLLSGACVCYTLVDGSVYYQHTGNVLTQVPFNASNCMELYKSVLSTVGGVMAMGGGGIASGIGAKLGGEVGGELIKSGKSMGSSGASSTMQGLTDLMQSKPTIQRGGTVAGNTGALCIKKPYITLTRAVQCLPADYQSQKGLPSYIYMNFSDLKGYTEVESVQLKGITATDDEKAELLALLKSGVIF